MGLLLWVSWSALCYLAPCFRRHRRPPPEQAWRRRQKPRMSSWLGISCRSPLSSPLLVGPCLVGPCCSHSFPYPIGCGWKRSILTVAAVVACPLAPSQLPSYRIPPPQLPVIGAIVEVCAASLGAVAALGLSTETPAITSVDRVRGLLPWRPWGDSPLVALSPDEPSCIVLHC